MSFFYSFRNADVTSNEEKDPVELFTACTKDALVVSEIFCLHADYRKDVPPPSKKMLVFDFCTRKNFEDYLRHKLIFIHTLYRH